MIRALKVVAIALLATPVVVVLAAALLVWMVWKMARYALRMLDWWSPKVAWIAIPALLWWQFNGGQGSALCFAAVPIAAFSFWRFLERRNARWAKEGHLYYKTEEGNYYSAETHF